MSKDRQAVLAIIQELKVLYPDGICSLEYQKDYELLFSVRLAAQCTDERVNQVTPALFARYPTLEALAQADISEVEQYIHSTGFFRAKARDIVLASQMLLRDYGGKVPNTMEDLLKLPGVGRKTANLILGDVYHVPGVVVADTHCIRITGLLGLTDGSKDPAKVEQYCKMYPQARAARSEAEVLEDPEVRLVAGACVTSQRCALGLRVMAAGKDYFTDKAPLTTLEQLAAARKATAETGRKYMCYYSERLHVESAVYAGQLIAQGAIGKVLNVTGFGPHRLGASGRPKWFFEKEKYGGILCDIGSHQIEQFLFFAGEEDARVQFSRVANYAHPEYPELEDYGDCSIVGANGATNYFRVDWFTPDGLRTWGDGRTFILGTQGYIEIRKYIDLAQQEREGDHVLLVNQDGEQHFRVHGQVGFPFFGELILDCLHRTENAMTQAHCFKAAELCVQAEMQAQTIGQPGQILHGPRLWHG